MDSCEIINTPSYLLYRRNCHGSTDNYFAYLTSTTEIKVMNVVNTFQTPYSIQIPLQPLRCLDIIQFNGSIYLAVALVTRFYVFKDREIFYESTIKLECNIVHFVGGYISVIKSQIKGNPVFIFITADGELTICNLTDKSRILKSPDKRPIVSYTSFAVDFPHIYLGDNNGLITYHKIDLENQRYSKISEYNTESNLPIMNIIVAPKFNTVISSTCYGEVVLLSQNLNQFSIVSVHHSAVTKLLVDEIDSRLLSVGEDSFLHEFRLAENRRIQPIKSEKLSSLVNVMFKCKQGVFMGQFEQKILRKI